MRTVVLLALASTVLTGPLAAQGKAAAPTVSNPAGPLVEGPAAKPPARHAAAVKRKRTLASHETQADKPMADADHAPVATRNAALPDDPVSLGLRWNGNNDSATQTRTQNYGGNAVGAGAAVGLNLHF